MKDFFENKKKDEKEMVKGMNWKFFRHSSTESDKVLQPGMHWQNVMDTNRE